MSVMPGSRRRGLSSMIVRPTTRQDLAAEPARECDLLGVVERLLADDEQREAIHQRAQLRHRGVVESPHVDAGQLAGEQRVERSRLEGHTAMFPWAPRYT